MTCNYKWTGFMYEPHVHMRGLMLCCFHLEILNHFWARGSRFSFYTELWKLCSWSWLNSYTGRIWAPVTGKEGKTGKEIREKEEGGVGKHLVWYNFHWKIKIVKIRINLLVCTAIFPWKWGYSGRKKKVNVQIKRLVSF